MEGKKNEVWRKNVVWMYAHIWTLENEDKEYLEWILDTSKRC